MICYYLELNKIKLQKKINSNNYFTQNLNSVAGERDFNIKEFLTIMR